MSFEAKRSLKRLNYCLTMHRIFSTRRTLPQQLPPVFPTEEKINQLIAGCGKKIATLLQLIKETGMRAENA